MFYGQLVADNTVILTDDLNGKPIVEAPEPSNVPTGYTIKKHWVDLGTQICNVCDIVPIEGTPEEAALALSKIQFMSLPDEAAYEFRALADEYVDGTTCYGEGNDAGMPVTRCRYAGELYRFIGQGVQVMQPGWNPVAAPSLWAQILPGQDGTVGEWVQPGSTNGYSKGDQVTHNGHLWESTADNNVWEPGAVGAPWTDLGEVQTS